MQVVHAFYFLLTLNLIVHHSWGKETKRITEKQHTLRLTEPYLQMKRREETRRRVSRDIPVKGLDGPLPGRLRRYFRIWLWRKYVSFFLLFSHKTTLWSKKKGPEGQTYLAIYGLHWVILPPLPPSTLQMGFVNKWRRQVFCDLTKKWQILVFFTEYRTNCSWNNFLFCVLHTSEWGGQPT